MYLDLLLFLMYCYKVTLGHHSIILLHKFWRFLLNFDHFHNFFTFWLKKNSIISKNNLVILCTDWITIPCATNSNNPTTQTGTPSVCVDRICGMVFNSATTSAGSNSVPVSSNALLLWSDIKISFKDCAMTESDQNSLKYEVWPIDSAYCLIVRQFY